MIDRKNDTDFDELEEIASDDTDEEEAGPDVQTALTNAVASTPVDFARLGITQMAYIRETVVNDMPMWGIFSAAGDPLGAATSFDQAWAAVQQHDLRPMRVH
ncbi:MAG: DUF1150 domain-containing protein [Rhodospirillaceae bacterium]|nr:DUF1150 domain-containing protein [Rhodospirillaceae bacterium]